jgi:hypothetical protein
MDMVTTGILDGQPAEATRREEAARPKDQSPAGNLVGRAEEMLGLSLDARQRALAAQAVHYGLGIVPGALYALLRHRVPLLGAGGGVAFGVLLWALNDEYLNTRLGLAGPPDAYPVEAHWRGLVGHIVLGVATDTGIDLLRG